jgi:hypothetical protein
MAIATITTQDDTDFYRSFTYQTTVGVPIDITGAVLVMMLRRKAPDVAAEMRLATDTGEIVITNPTGGQFTILITTEQMQKELSYGAYVHSLIMTLHGLDQRIWNGTLTHSAGPSRHA